MTETESELVDRIVEIAQQPELLRHLRKNIRKHVQFSNLTNAAEFTRELESLYRQCWKKLSAEMKNSNIIQSRSHHFSLSDQYLSVSDGSTKIQFPIDKVDVNIGGIIESGQWCPPDFKMIENLLSSAEKVIDFLPTSPTFFYSFIHILKGKDHTNLIDTKHYLGEIRHFPINTLDIGAGDTESTLAKADFIHSYHFSDAFELMNTLQNSKPIIVISPENMLELDSPLPDACASHGYQIFRYLPLIDQLVEISPQSLKGASSRLSAVCIPKERVNALVENKVILQDSNRPPVSEQLPNWVEQMKKMDYARNFVDEWQTEARRNPATNQHMKAIQHYLASMESENKEDCYDHLLNAFHLILPMLKSAPGISNLLTAARITSTLSLSDSTLDILEMVLQILREDENLNLSEAFLPPSSEFDHINPEDNFAGWIMACVTECREHHRTQSFLNSSEEDISQLTTHCQSSFASEFSKKRLFLLKKFFSDISSPYETTEIDTSPASDEKYYSIYDYILICAPSSIDYMTSYVFMEQRDWFEDEIRFVRKLIQPGMNIIDIGANYGAYTLSIADKLKGQGHIWAFEPTKKTHDCLQKSIHKNQYSNITLIRTGLSDHKGTATFYTSPNSELNSLSRIEGISGSEETISLTTLDDFFHENHLPQIDFIKLDAEGEEIRILQKSKQFLEKNSPLIMYELKHGSNINTPLIKELAKHGYKSYRLIPGTETLIPFDHTQSFDGYLLNLFACKDDRSINLIKNEHLILDMPNEIIPDKDVLMNYLCQLSIILGKKTTTQLTNNSHPLYLDMLTHYLCSKDDKLNTKTRTAHLYHALRLSQGILNSGDESAEVLISASRIAIDLGDRTGGVNLLQKVINRIEILLKTDIKQLPLPANENFEKMHSNGQLKEWLISSAIDQLIRKHAFSTYFTGKQSIQLFKKLENLGFNNEDMKIKFGLLKKRLQLS
ncbi:MAG: FkbM family methyltransferase [Deltaproteobacteria bacterium]|nr:FkbM family methyltransferase [Deltaproteobacteria bacterium]